MARDCVIVAAPEEVGERHHQHQKRVPGEHRFALDAGRPEDASQNQPVDEIGEKRDRAVLVQRSGLRPVQGKIGHGRLARAGDHVAHALAQELADGAALAVAVRRFLGFLVPQHCAVALRLPRPHARLRTRRIRGQTRSGY
jgi:hypothetical protein